jgi:hypothetical protein
VRDSGSPALVKTGMVCGVGVPSARALGLLVTSQHVTLDLIILPAAADVCLCKDVSL